jgi:hypothetical protein
VANAAWSVGCHVLDLVAFLWALSGMYKIIGADQKEYGPVTAEQLRQWTVDGRANAQTLVQPEGSTDWQPLSAFPELNPAAAPLGAATEGYQEPFNPDAIADRDYQLDIGSCLSRGWALVKSNLGLMVGATVLVMLISNGCSLIPILGMVLGLVINGPLYGGLYWLVLRLIRGEEASIGDAFAGFSRAFGQLVLVVIVTGLLTLLSAILLIAAVALGATHLVPLAVAIVLGIIGILPPIYLSICWAFTMPLVVDKQIDFWSAMQLSRQQVSRHWWAVFGLMLVGGLLAVLGLIACLVGILVTLPIFLGAIMYAYEDIFGGPYQTAA